MAIQIKTVASRKELREFVNFPDTLYNGNGYYVPKLKMDEMDTLDPARNPASEFCDFELYLALKDGKTAGRIAAIVNRKANGKWNHNEVRFGWFDAIDDREVFKALIDKVIEFGHKHGMDSIVGPLGFTDFDPEGMLVEGYDRLCTMALIYNHPYYVEHLEALGFTKEADWVEYHVTVPESLPDKYTRVAEIVKNRNDVHLLSFTKKDMMDPKFGQDVFRLINRTYCDLYNFTILPESMAEKYFGFYLKFLSPKYLSVIANNKGEYIAFGVLMPSIVRALQKCKGKILPSGWFHLLKSLYLKHEDGVELLLIGVLPEYRNTGINSLLFTDIFSKISSLGYKWAETNAVLETNQPNQKQWELFEHECRKRRRSYKMPI